MSALFRKAALAALALAGGMTLAQAETPAELNFGVISTEASMNQKKNWEPFIEAMSKATGLKIKAFYSTDYAVLRFSLMIWGSLTMHFVMKATP